MEYSGFYLNVSHTNVPDCPGPPRTEIWPIRGQIRVWSGVIRDNPGWSCVVRHGPGHHHGGFKIAGVIRDSPGAVRDGPCSDRVGSGKVRSGTVLIRGDPAW